MIKKGTYGREKKSSKMIFLPIVTFLIVSLLFAFSQTYHESWNFKWNGIRQEVKNTVLLLKEENQITFNKTTQSGDTIQQWYRQKWFKENLTDKELLKLANYPNGVIKALSYETFLERENTDKFSLLKKSFNDSLVFVSYKMGCIGSDFYLIDYLINFKYQLGQKYKVKDTYPLEKELTKEQLEEILKIYEKRMSRLDFYKDLYFKSLK